MNSNPQTSRNASPPPVSRYRDRVTACWLGKAVGGTLGMPTEGRDGPFNFSYYDPVPTTMVANDDLDLQVLWAVLLSELDQPVVDRRVWVDGKYEFGRESDRMAPSAHRVPINQYVDRTLSAGEHTLTAALVQPRPARPKAEWVVAITDAHTKQWIPNVFRATEKILCK